MTLKLTDTRLKKQAPQATDDETHWDSEITGFRRHRRG
jgi:hypothetical protein